MILNDKKKTRISTEDKVSVMITFNIFSLCFEVVAKYCKRLIKKKVFRRDHEKNDSRKQK